MRVILYPHRGSRNHGCEAIVRSTSKVLNENLFLYSSSIEEDLEVKLDICCAIFDDSQQLSRYSLSYLKTMFLYYIKHDKYAFDYFHFLPIFEGAKKADVILSIGGDNYCYGVPGFIYLINKYLRKSGHKTVLWGCSIEPGVIDKQMLEDLSGYTKIFVRESLTYQAIREKGLQNVVLYPDPAFQLNRIDLPLPDKFEEGNTVGINVSPMIIGYEKEKGTALANYITLMEYILEETNMKIALISHVVWSHNDDRIPLNQLYDRFKYSERVIMIEDHAAEELKGYIARCRFMVAARTHASIAAYSQSVPTLVVGYSVKAFGIAKDIFGTIENYVVPVQSLKEKETLTKAFRFIQENELNIRNHYAVMMKDYCNQALLAGNALKDLIK